MPKRSMQNVVCTKIKYNIKKGVGGWEILADRASANQKKWSNGIKVPLRGPRPENSDGKTPSEKETDRVTTCDDLLCDRHL